MSDERRTITPTVSPRVSILDPSFKYVNAAHTDLRETFKRIRKEIEKAAQAKPANVRTLKRKEA